MSTEYPLTLLVMELSETLRFHGCDLNLQWIPRERNQLADDLTNEKFDHFPTDCRKRWIGGDTKWITLEKMIFKPREAATGEVGGQGETAVKCERKAA